MCEIMETLHLKPMGKQQLPTNALRIHIGPDGVLSLKQWPNAEIKMPVSITPDSQINRLFPAENFGLGDYSLADLLRTVGGPFETRQRPILASVRATVAIIRSDQDNPALAFNPLATHISIMMGANPDGELLRGTVVFINYNEVEGI